MKMKTKIILLITILALSFSISFANTGIKLSESKPVEYSVQYLSLSSPVAADFSDPVPLAETSSTIIIPVTPREATFDDETSQESFNEEPLPSTLSPSTPAEADFEDNI
jgi:hypothetical protein